MSSATLEESRGHLTSCWNRLDPEAPVNLPLPAVTVGATTQRQEKTIHINGPRRVRVYWGRFRRRLSAGTSPSTPSLLEDSATANNVDFPTDSNSSSPGEDNAEVDEVVVDRNWSEDTMSSVSLSEQSISPGKLGSPSADHDSVAVHTSGVWGLCTPLVVLRWRLFPAIVNFFSPKFPSKKSELHYIKENWFMRKPLAIWSSLFLVVNWVVNTLLVLGPVLLIDKIFLYGIAPACTFAVLPAVIYDWPRDRPNVYQLIISISIWCWGCYELAYISLCGLYNSNSSIFSCGKREFMTMFYFLCALQTVALFGLRQKRFPAVIGATVWVCLASAVILPHRKVWTKNVLNFIIFQGFLVCVHYKLEMSERRLYILRDQLKMQFLATQRAQINERKAADSKRRLTSYVRVPLNTALLAVQNMEATGVVPRAQEIEFKALEGSLGMMSKVLNDVLDFNRMDSGRFESVSRPYSFHQVIRGLFVPLRLATDARHLELVTDLDPCIDKVAHDAMCLARGLDPETVFEDAPALVVGDETRLMQIVTNLASNACKFTPPGGRVRIATRLIVPACSHHGFSTDQRAEDETEKGKRARDGTVEIPELSESSLDQHNRSHDPRRNRIVVRIEVTDTGYGIPPKEMVQSKLFSAFNQTEQGKQQGGKGTGLGLALVRQIVKRSGGRLGVSSRVGKGSTFWVELPLGIGLEAIVQRNPAPVPLVDENLLKVPSPQLSVDVLNKAPGEDRSPHLIIDVGPPRGSTGLGARVVGGSGTWSPTGSQHSSAMHSLMDQGGLVEIGPNAHASPSVITRTIGDALALATTPEEEVDNPADAIATPSLMSMALPALPIPVSVQATPDTPSCTSQNPEVLVTYATPRPPSPVLVNPPDIAISLLRARPSWPLSGSEEPPTTVPTGLPVLVVDDDALTRTLMTRMLSRLGCKVSTAENGSAALEMVLGDCSGTFAVVFLDNQMPVMSGLSMVSKLREAGRGDFVVGVTGNALLSDQEEYLEAGVDKVLTKPVRERNLRSMLAVASERLSTGAIKNSASL